MSVEIPCTTFSNGLSIPILGFGTWKLERSEVEQVLSDAVHAGYRHIDCAYIYQNEAEVGKAIKRLLAEGVVKREDLFVTSKLWNACHRPDIVEESLRTSLRDLNLDYLDLYLIHWPMDFEGNDDGSKKDKNYIPYTDTWLAMEKLVKKGLIKSIGLSNFNSKQIADIMAVATIPPVNNQVECHAYLNQKKLKAFCESKGIRLAGYSPLGSGDTSLMKDPVVVKIAKKHNKSPAQILIKYQVQRDIIAITKSVKKERIISNGQIFDFKLDTSDMNQLDSLDKGKRFSDFEREKDHPQFPFKEEF